MGPNQKLMFHGEPSVAEAFDRLLVRELGAGNVYSVGGRVRDEVLADLGRPLRSPPDLDYLVSCVPYDDIVHKLSRVGTAELVGASFGVIKFTRDGTTVDVALPRRERSTGTHHRDFEVESAPDIPLTEDLSRRDFRMNMMARDVASGELIDPYRGVHDLRERRLDILKDQVFEEDPLRILRGAQFAARFELVASDRTRSAMSRAAHLTPAVAPERIADELTKLFTRAEHPSIGLELLREVGALEHVMPELLEGWGVEQNEFHRYTVYYHALESCDAAPPKLELRLAALLHDIAKPRTKSGPHFYRHEIVGEEMAKAMLTKLRFSADTVSTVASLVRHHMFVSDDSLTGAAIRRFIHRVGKAHVQELFELRKADIIASGLPERDNGELERFKQRVEMELAGPHVLRIEDLALDGTDVMELMRGLGLVAADFRGDARVGAALRACLDAVLENPEQNTQERLREIVRDFLRREES